jgi:hypothetical protein
MLDKKLIEAYTNTQYIVESPVVNIKIGNKCPDVDRLMVEKGLTDWAFITAHNPKSKQLMDELNEDLHRNLVNSTSNYICHEGYGKGEDDGWKPEVSILVLGISKEEAKAIGEIFNQNAIIVGSLNSKAKLLIID